MDYGRIKELICEAFEFDEFMKNRDFLDLILNIYLQNCILGSLFGKLAEKNNRVISIILSKASADRNHLGKFHNILSTASSGLNVITYDKVLHL